MPDDEGALDHGFTVVIFVSGRAQNFLPTLRSFGADFPFPIVAGSADAAELEVLRGRVKTLESPSAAALINSVWRQTGGNIFSIGDAVLAPPDFAGPALEAVEADVRVATVSFLSNAAGPLSFPEAGRPAGRVLEGEDEVSITRRLRSLPPAPMPAPIPLAAGPVVLVSSAALGAAGVLEDAPSGTLEASLADFCMRASAKGFLHLADMGTFYARPSDLTVAGADHTSTGPGEEDVRWLASRHRLVEAVLGQTMAAQSPARLEHQTARAKVEGLEILVDATCLGPQQMGTQVMTSALIGSLAKRDDVNAVWVALGGEVPGYAAEVLDHPKVRSKTVTGGNVSVFPRVDVIHRPFQPDENVHVGDWRKTAERVVLSMLDLIAYRTAGYHSSARAWEDYRGSFRRSAQTADGVVGISNDVKEQVRLERLPIEPDRFFVVHPGTDHLTGTQSAKAPDEMLRRGFIAKQFLVTLGATYSHKNLDLALETVTELRRRGMDLQLILAGPCVPFGSSKVAESLIEENPETVLTLPDVSPEERNWLLKHASAVLYPTSAEGFGFIPHEAAHLGTPTICVGFGPFKEVLGRAPVQAADWRASSLAGAVETILSDPAVRRMQIEATLAAGKRFTWESTVAALVQVYRTLLARPSVEIVTSVEGA